MRRWLLVLACLLLAGPCLAALPATTVWEVNNTAGSADTNGGGFDPSAGAGTDMSYLAAGDYSNKNAAGCTNCQSAVANLSVVDAVTTAASTTVTSATAAFTSAINHGIVYMTGCATPMTPGPYFVHYATPTTITLDRSTGLVTSTGCTLNIGGSLLTIGEAMTRSTVAGMTTWVKATATYSITAAITPPSDGTWSALIGYGTTRNDTGRPTIQAAAAVKGIVPRAGWHVRNFILDGNNTGTYGLDATAAYLSMSNLKIMGGWTTYGAYMHGWRVSV
jgi:hypothetical protein